MLLLDMAYRLLQEFRQAFTRLDTPPLSNRRHPGSSIARFCLLLDKTETNFRAFAYSVAALMNLRLKVKLCP